MENDPKHWSRIVFFDGYCALCNQSVMFLVKYERGKNLKFISLQSKIAEEILPGHVNQTGLQDSIVYLEDGRVYERSDAVMRLAGQLRQPWRSFRLFSFIPKRLRDSLYDFIARKRYMWFGRYDRCRIGGDDFKDRIIV